MKDRNRTHCWAVRPPGPLRSASVGLAATLALSGMSQAAFAQECNTVDDVEGGLFMYSTENGFEIDRIEGAASQTPLSVHGWLRAEHEEPDTQALFALHILEDKQGDVLDRQSWRYVDHDSTTLGDITYFGVQDVYFTDQEIPAGGMGRYRGLSIWYNSCEERYESEALHTYLAPSAPSLGTDSMGYQMLSGLVASNTLKPSERADTEYLGHGRSKFDPGLRGAAANAETRAYYDTVRTGKDGTGPSVSASLGTLQDFRNRYFAPGVGKELVSEYYNEGDLGIGREMHCNFEVPGLTAETYERACYVSNYAPCQPGATLPNGLCQRPIFDDEAAAKQIQKNDGVPFATVAMVERGDMGATEPNAVFFAVYVCDANSDCSVTASHVLADGPVALDNHGVASLDQDPNAPRGSNTFNPGNCMSCHGTGGSYDAGTHSTTGAYFLPFDQNAFSYLETSSSSPLSKQGQHNVMREMNAHIAYSHLGTVGNATRLIENWYDGDFVNGQFNGARSPNDLGFEGSTVNDSTTHESSGALYANVYGRACRGCHITHGGLFQFSEYDDWLAFGAVMKDRLCDSHEMPLAERTQDLVWDGHVRQSFFQHLGLTTTECKPPQAP